MIDQTEGRHWTQKKRSQFRRERREQIRLYVVRDLGQGERKRSKALRNCGTAYLSF